MNTRISMGKRCVCVLYKYAPRNAGFWNLYPKPNLSIFKKKIQKRARLHAMIDNAVYKTMHKAWESLIGLFVEQLLLWPIIMPDFYSIAKDSCIPIPCTYPKPNLKFHLITALTTSHSAVACRNYFIFIVIYGFRITLLFGVFRVVEYLLHKYKIPTNNASKTSGKRLVQACLAGDFWMKKPQPRVTANIIITWKPMITRIWVNVACVLSKVCTKKRLISNMS